MNARRLGELDDDPGKATMAEEVVSLLVAVAFLGLVLSLSALCAGRLWGLMTPEQQLGTAGLGVYLTGLILVCAGWRR